MPLWEQKRDRAWERWVRNWMGLRDSPYRSIQLMILAKEDHQKFWIGSAPGGKVPTELLGAELNYDTSAQMIGFPFTRWRHHDCGLRHPPRWRL